MSNEPEGTLSDFLLARIAEDKAAAESAEVESGGREHWALDLDGKLQAEFEHIVRHDPARVLADCEAKRRIVELHQSWPVLVETPPTFDTVDPTDVTAMTFRASRQIQWQTEQEYRVKFGDEPPTAPMLAALAEVYADHPGYRDEWRP